MSYWLRDLPRLPNLSALKTEFKPEESGSSPYSVS